MKKVDQDRSEFLREMIDYWRSEGLVDSNLAEKLHGTYETKSFDWRRLAQYSFWIAMACGIISLGALFVDKTLLNYLQKLYDTPNIVICLSSALAAFFLFKVGLKRKKTKPELLFSNEALVLSAVLFTANAIAYLGKSLQSGNNHFSLLIGFAVVVYAVLAIFFQSRSVWLFALVSFAAWFGTETGYLSKWNWYFMGLNYPLRFVIFGFAIVLSAFTLKRSKRLSHFFTTTYICGMAYFFIALWFLSIFGNYGILEDWYAVKQISLFYWAILSAACCLIAIFVGLHYGDEIAREFGIAFLFINLYTRYFEYFWDSWHKALFFSVLALSFWLIGRKAEQIWRLRK